MTASLDEVRQAWRDREWPYVSINDSSLEAMAESLDKRFPDAVEGVPYFIAQTGERYVSFDEYSLSRPADIEFIKRDALNTMAQKLSDYLMHADGQVYWRQRLNDDVEPATQVVRFDPEGHDVDPWTNKRCVLDKNWLRYCVSCRVLRSDKPVLK